MKRPIRSQLLLVLVVLSALLTACDTILEMGVEPTVTPIPTPTLTPTPSLTLETYTNEEYGFTFEYLSTWALTEEPHMVKLSQDTLTLRIGYRWATESVDIWGRTGAPAGDFIYSDKILFLGKVIPAHVLEYQRKDKAVFYGESGLIEGEELDFVIYLDDLDGTKYDELDIPKELQAEVKEILESFARIEATARPPAATPTTAPSATTAPTVTPGPTATAEARSSEIIPLGMTWNQYTNYRMGFSIKVPVTMVSFRGACKWNEKDGDRSFRPDPALVPVRIFEDIDSVYIAPEYLHELSGEWKQANGRSCFAECNRVPISLALLQDPEKPWFSAQMWKFVATEVRDDDELDGFIKSRYGSGCSLGEKTASGQDGVYDVSIQGDGKDLSETLCPLNYATVVKYYPRGNKVIAWDLGQAYTFPADVNYSVVHDQEMVESFRFLTETPTVAPSPTVEEGLVTYADEAYGFSFQYPASWTLTEVPERTMDTGRCARMRSCSARTRWPSPSSTCVRPNVALRSPGVAWVRSSSRLPETR